MKNLLKSGPLPDLLVANDRSTTVTSLNKIIRLLRTLESHTKKKKVDSSEEKAEMLLSYHLKVTRSKICQKAYPGFSSCKGVY